MKTKETKETRNEQAQRATRNTKKQRKKDGNLWKFQLFLSFLFIKLLIIQITNEENRNQITESNSLRFVDIL